MAETSDVVIVGGGVAGCATAYYLSQAGVKVTIIEREGISSQASGYSAGGLNPLEGSCIPGPLSALAMASFRLHKELWGALRKESEIDFQSRIISLTKVAFAEAEVPALQESMNLFEDAREEGFSGEWLHRSEILKLEPRLSPKLIGGVRLFGNATLSSLLFTQALAEAAQKQGATVIKGNARGVKLDNGRVLAVILEDREISCEQLVLAAGPWSREAETWLDISLPVDPLKGEILRLELNGPPLAGDLQRRRRFRLPPGRRPSLVRHHRSERRLQPGTHRGGERNYLERGQGADAGTCFGHSGPPHCLPPSPHSRLYADSGPRPGLGQCSPGHRRRQEGHFAIPRYGQSHC